jgi:hypothetical protein
MWWFFDEVLRLKFFLKKEVRVMLYLTACHTLAAKEEKSIHSDKFYSPIILFESIWCIFYGGDQLKTIKKLHWP